MLADQLTDARPEPPAPRRWRPLDLPLALGLGVVAVALGLLPWLLTGLRLPLQNLWAADTAPDQMPRALLPFSQYAVALIAAMLLIGAGVAGLVARLLRHRTPVRWWLVTASVVALAQLVALVQTAAVVTAGLPLDGVVAGSAGFQPALADEALVYVVAIAFGAFLVIAAGFGLLALVARAPVPGAVLGLTVASLLLGVWLQNIVTPALHVPSPAQSQLMRLVSWAPAVAVGVALAWCGARSAGRIAAAIAALLILWLGPGLIDAVSGALGSRALLDQPLELAQYGGLALRGELFSLSGTPGQVLLAVVIGALGAVGLELWRRRGGAGRGRGSDAGSGSGAGSGAAPDGQAAWK